jgi:hypothetical protein
VIEVLHKGNQLIQKMRYKEYTNTAWIVAKLKALKASIEIFTILDALTNVSLIWHTLDKYYEREDKLSHATLVVLVMLSGLQILS